MMMATEQASQTARRVTIIKGAHSQSRECAPFLFHSLGGDEHVRDQKTMRLGVRVTESERARIEEYAARHNLTKSKAARRLFEVGLVVVTSEGSSGLISKPAGAALSIAHLNEV